MNIFISLLIGNNPKQTFLNNRLLYYGPLKCYILVLLASPELTTNKTSSSVAENDSTSSCGRFDIKPIVSKNTFIFKATFLHAQYYPMWQRVDPSAPWIPLLSVA